MKSQAMHACACARCPFAVGQLPIHHNKLCILYLRSLCNRTENQPFASRKCKMSTSTLDMNAVPTAKIAYDALRQHGNEKGAPVSGGPLMPWELLKARLSRRPNVFIVTTLTPAGDEAPFMSLLAVSSAMLLRRHALQAHSTDIELQELVQQLPGTYVMLRARPKHFQDGNIHKMNVRAESEIGRKVFQTKNGEEFKRKARENHPDVVLTSQIFYGINGKEVEQVLWVECRKVLLELWAEMQFAVYT